MNELIESISKWLSLANGFASLVGIIMAAIALRYSYVANKTAKAGLTIASFTYKKEVAPSISLRARMSELTKNSNTQAGYIEIINNAVGVALIDGMSSERYTNDFLWDQKPFKLKKGATKSVYLDFDSSTYRDGIINMLIVNISYTDIIGTKYQSTFQFNDTEKRYIGKVEEL